MPAAVRFVSAEPLLGDLGVLDLAGIDFVIIGCESRGKMAGRFADGYEAAARRIVEQCRQQGVGVFHKQMPIDGRVSHEPSEWPEDLRLRMIPNGAPR